jgi:ParB family transcriptional regulator, chromosome partitioning protein
MMGDDEKVIYEAGKLYNVPVDEIDPNPNQPRKHFDPEGITELSESISIKGFIQPIALTTNEAKDKVILVSGERRLRAAKEAGQTEIPGYFIKEDSDLAEMALIENVMREDLTPVEQAEAIQTLIKNNKINEEDVGKLLGKSQPTISGYVAVANLPEDIRDQCREDPRFALRELIKIARIKNEKAQKKKFEHYVKRVNGEINPPGRPEGSVDKFETAKKAINNFMSKEFNKVLKLNESEKRKLKTELESVKTAVEKLLKEIG